MSFVARVASASDMDGFQAGANAVLQSLNDLSTPPSAIILFTPAHFEHSRVLAGALSVAPKIPIVGASTAGEILGDGRLKKSAVVAIAFGGEGIKVAVSAKESLGADSKIAAQSAGEEIVQKLSGQPEALIFFFDGISGFGSDVVDGLKEVFSSQTTILGAGSADNGKFEGTYQYAEGNVYTKGLVLLGISGKIKVSTGVKHGWIPVGVPMRATKSKGSVLYELDDKPAISLYENYFGEKRMAELSGSGLGKLAVSYPLGMRVAYSQELLLRAPYFGNKDGSISLGGHIPEGAEVRLMVGGKEEAVLAAKMAGNFARQSLKTSPKLALVFDAHTRGRLFGLDSNEEIAALHDVLGRDIPLAGFYSYSEQASLWNLAETESFLVNHNEAIAVMLIG